MIVFKGKCIAVPDRVNGQPVRNLCLSGIPDFVEKIVIPATITNLSDISNYYLFDSSYGPCGKSLKEVEIAEDNPAYWSDGKVIYSKDKTALIRMVSPSEKEYTIREGTKTIYEQAFAGMKELHTLSLPNSIVQIQKQAFIGCSKLSRIEGLNHSIEVEDNIFGNDVPFEVNSDVLIIGTTLIKNTLLSEKVIRVPDGITKIYSYAFGRTCENDLVEEIVLPPTVKTIGSCAFRGRKHLKRINIPNGVAEIKDRVFSECESLEEIQIPASVNMIALNAFPTYHAALITIKEQKCALRAVNVDPENEQYCSVNGMLFSKDQSKLLFVPYELQTQDFQIPEGVSEINKSLLAGNNCIKSLILPDSLTCIGEGAFWNCSSLERVVFPDGMEEIGKQAFAQCAKLSIVRWPAKLKTIGDTAFCETALSEVLLPESVTHIGAEAFARTQLKEVTLPKSVRTLGWGAFSMVPEITVYDSIDPDSKDASAAIDTLNGNPNSLVGYVGMGPAWAMWQCAANHRWVNYTITVRSAETDEIKYKVWMGADSSQRDYYCFLSSAWGHSATFAFEELDEFFRRIRGNENKLQVAKYRLEYPVNLPSDMRRKYEAFIAKNQ